MSALGQKRTWRDQIAMSALPPIADIPRRNLISVPVIPGAPPIPSPPGTPAPKLTGCIIIIAGPPQDRRPVPRGRLRNNDTNTR